MAYCFNTKSCEQSSYENLCKATIHKTKSFSCTNNHPYIPYERFPQPGM